MVRKVTFKRLLNLIVLYMSWIAARYFKIIHIKGTPAFASVEPTTACNLSCPECPAGTGKFFRKKGNIKKEDFCNYIDKLLPNLIWLNLYFQGEPFLHPQFMDMIAYAGKKNIYTATSTNGHFLTDENCKALIDAGLDRIVISIDGLDQETYQRYRRGGDVNTVKDGVIRLVKHKAAQRSKKPYIILQSLLLKSNENQLIALKNWWKETGADELQLKKAQFYDFYEGNQLMPDNQSVSRYRKVDEGKFVINSKLPDYCKRLWFTVVITWDGELVPCCFDKDAAFSYGNISSGSLNEIWKGEKSINFRKRVFSNRKSIPICCNCSEGLR